MSKLSNLIADLRTYAENNGTQFTAPECAWLAEILERMALAIPAPFVDSATPEARAAEAKVLGQFKSGSDPIWELFYSWWLASKYCQVVIPRESWCAIAWDGFRQGYELGFARASAIVEETDAG